MSKVKPRPEDISISGGYGHQPYEIHLKVGTRTHEWNGRHFYGFNGQGGARKVTFGNRKDAEEELQSILEMLA